MRVAVTGGSGRIGREVVRQFADRGHEVLNIDRAPGADQIVQHINIDLSQRDLVRPIFETVDAVCHLGEYPTILGQPPEDTFGGNARIGAVVLQAAADVKVKRVIYTSTCQVYGFWGDSRWLPPKQLPMTEDCPVDPQNAYALSKVANESYARMLAVHEGLSVASFRLPWVIADGVNDDRSETFKWLETGDHHDREGMCTYLHGTDAGLAYVLAVENPRPGYDVYHFTAAEVLSLKPIRERLMKQWPGAPVLPEDWPKYKSPVDTSKAEAHFGWRAKFNMLDEYRKNRGVSLA